MISVNRYRMVAAREATGLTVRQVGVQAVQSDMSERAA
jgi:hypothetical protein